MFATLENRGPHELAGEPAFLQGYALRRLGDDRTTTLALWSDSSDPMAYTVEYDHATTEYRVSLVGLVLR